MSLKDISNANAASLVFRATGDNDVIKYRCVAESGILSGKTALSAINIVKRENYDIRDLVRAKKESAGMLTSVTFDTDGNGMVNSNELSYIRKALLGKR